MALQGKAGSVGESEILGSSCAQDRFVLIGTSLHGQHIGQAALFEVVLLQEGERRLEFGLRIDVPRCSKGKERQREKERV